MTSIVKFTAVSGLSGDDPLCYLLSIDNYNFLLDCGWTDSFDLAMMERLKPHIPQIDAVLLTYPDLHHLGGLPYVVGKLGLNCPIYATLPVFKMGEMFMYDLYQSHVLFQDFELFDLDDVDAAFGMVKKLKYQQVEVLQGKGTGIQIQALNAGHLIGGTVWVINTDQEEFVYAVDFDHKRGRHLEGVDMKSILRPSLLITDSYNALAKHQTTTEKEGELLDIVKKTVAESGNVLMPIDTAGRVLEICLLFDEVLRKIQKERRKTEQIGFTVCWLNAQADDIRKFARSTLEWMNDSLVKGFEETGLNPFDFGDIKESTVRIIGSLEEISHIDGPKVVLATQESLNVGFARELFVEYASDHKNAIVFTHRPFQGSLAYDLFVKEQREFKLTINRRIPLEGDELEKFMTKRKSEIDAERMEKEKEELQRLEEMDIDEDEIENDQNNVTVLEHPHDIPMEDFSAYSSYFKHSLRYPMYPCLETRLKFDDYGAVFKVEDLSKAVESHSKKVKDLEDKRILEEEELERQLLDEAKRNISFEKDLVVNANISLVNFESRSDGKSILEYLKNMAPRQVILVNGSQEATDSFVDHFVSNPKDFGEVVVPPGNETMDVSSELNIYQATLTDQLMGQLQFQAINFSKEEFELCHVDGILRMGEKQVVPALEPAPEKSGHNAVFVGEIALYDFNQILITKGIETRYVQGALVCDDIVRVRKENGQLLVEGPVCSRYYEIRELLYSQFAIV